MMVFRKIIAAPVGLLCLAGANSAQAAFTTSLIAQITTAASGLTTLTTSATVPANNLILVVCTVRAAASPCGTTHPTDTAGDTFTLIQNQTTQAAFSVWYTYTSGLSSGTIAVTMNSAAAGIVYAYSVGGTAVNGLDTHPTPQCGSGSATSSSPGVLSGGLASSPEILFGFLTTLNGPGTVTDGSTEAGSWTLLSSFPSTGEPTRLVDLITTSPDVASQTYLPTWTAAQQWCVGVVSFRAAGANTTDHNILLLGVGH